MVAQLGNNLAAEEQRNSAAQQQPALANSLVTTTLAPTTLAHATTMADAGAAAARDSSVMSYIIDENEDMVSEDSLTVSPEAARSRRPRSGARSLSGSRGKKGDGVTRPLLGRARSATPTTRHRG